MIVTINAEYTVEIPDRFKVVESFDGTDILVDENGVKYNTNLCFYTYSDKEEFKDYSLEKLKMAMADFGPVSIVDEEKDSLLKNIKKKQTDTYLKNYPRHTQNIRVTDMDIDG